ncbi:hypothetical protein D9M68_876310 [compost metagenome]
MVLTRIHPPEPGFFLPRIQQVLNDSRQREQPLEVSRGLLGQGIEADPAQHGQVLGHLTHILRQIRLAAVRHRRQVWRVGFHQQAIGRHLAGDFT